MPNPKRRNILMTSSPESRLSFDMTGFEFKAGQQRSSWSQAKFVQVLTFQVQGDCLPQVRNKLVQSLSLGDDGQIQTFSNVIVTAFRNTRLNCSFH